jgi:opacity protein-like surface antigen
MTNKILRTVVMGSLTLLAFSNAAHADMKPYIEGQINYVNPDDVSTNTYSGSVSGITYTNTKIDFDFDSDTTMGFELGLSKIADSNFRLGFSYTKPSLDLDTSTLSGTITDGVTTVTGAVGITSADYASVGLSFDNDVKVYMANVYYDFDATENFKPFIGVGLGMSDIDNAEDKELTYSGMLGAKYYFSEQAYLGGKFTYSTIDGPTDKLGLKYEDIDFYTSTLSLGFEF